MTNFEDPYRKVIDDIWNSLGAKYKFDTEAFPIEYRIDLNTLIVKSYLHQLNHNQIKLEHIELYRNHTNIVVSRLIRDVSTTILNKHCK